jgi:hypothetical protein
MKGGGFTPSLPRRATEMPRGGELFVNISDFRGPGMYTRWHLLQKTRNPIGYVLKIKR